jgi:mannan endo-1,4-beta-mannosidase
MFKAQASDPKATRETLCLFQQLKEMSGRKILFGQKDAFAYGVHWKESPGLRSDIKDVCGSHPALFGWDLEGLNKTAKNLDDWNFRNIREWIKEVYRRGGVNTISWHMKNYVTGGYCDGLNGGNVVASILPGGPHHAAFKADLDVFARFIRGTGTGFLGWRKTPIIFRPFHEHTGNWFWWGQPHCSPDEYKTLWRFTITYLREKKGLHNLLFAYSPDVFRDKGHYLECYPGDEYVDVMGLDDYRDVEQGGNLENFLRCLRDLVEMAEQRGKISALTETGEEGIKNPKWWTERLLHPIGGDPVASRICWIMVWRNADERHHYAPYPGHPSVPDFLKFVGDSRILLLDQVPDFYGRKARP